jgi:hypothetical protein
VTIDKGSEYPIYAATREEYDALAQEYLKKFGKPAPELPPDAERESIGEAYGKLYGIVFPVDMEAHQ